MTTPNQTPTPPPLPQQPAPQAKKGGCLRVFLIVIGIGFGLICLFGIIGALVDSSGSKSASSEVSSTPSAPEADAATPAERPISWREVDSIYNLKGNNTDLQKDEEWKRFKGRRVTWSGTVSAISDGWTGLTLQVKMNPDAFVSDLLITLKKSGKTKAVRLHQGDHVKFTGRLENWGSLMPITLDQGEIVE